MPSTKALTIKHRFQHLRKTYFRTYIKKILKKAGKTHVTGCIYLKNIF